MTLAQDLTRLGIAVPEPLAAADALREAVLNYTSTAKPEVDELCGRLPTMSPSEAVDALGALGMALAARGALPPFRDSYLRALDTADQRALVASADELYATLKPLVEVNGARLAEVVAMIGPAPDSKQLTRVGHGSHAAYDEFVATVETLNAVRMVVQTMLGQVTSSMHRVMTVDVPAATWVALDELRSASDVERLNASHGFAALVHAGFVLTCNRPADVAARMSMIESGASAVDAERRRHQAEANAAYGEQTARAWLEGTVLPRG